MNKKTRAGFLHTERHEEKKKQKENKSGVDLFQAGICAAPGFETKHVQTRDKTDAAPRSATALHAKFISSDLILDTFNTKSI